MPKFRLFTLYSIGFLAGIFVASFLKIDFILSYPIFIFIVLLLLLSAFVNILFKIPFLNLLSFVLLFVLAGIAYYSHFDSKHKPAFQYGVEQVISGKIIKKPQVDYSSQKITIETKEKDRILVTLPEYPRLQYGDTLMFKGKIDKPKNFDQFNYENYLKGKLVFGVVGNTGSGVEYSTKLSFPEKIVRGLYNFSDEFQSSLNRVLPEPEASLAAGLLLGESRNLPENYSNALKATGLTHIVALSGFNVTIIILILTAFLSSFLSKKQVLLIGSLLILLFVVMTGASSSVVRAAIFSLFVLLGKSFGRKADFINLMLLAAFLMVLYNPYSIRFDAGFQLSFLAFSGLIFLSPVITKLFEKEKFDFMAQEVKSTLAETLSAQIMVLPLLVFMFGQLSIIAPLSNLLVLWIVPYAMGFSFVAGIVSMFFYPLGKIAALITWPFLTYVVKIPLLLAKMPLASLNLGKGALFIEILSFAIIAVYLKVMYRKLRIKL